MLVGAEQLVPHQAGLAACLESGSGSECDWPRRGVSRDAFPSERVLRDRGVPSVMGPGCSAGPEPAAGPPLCRWARGDPFLGDDLDDQFVGAVGRVLQAHVLGQQAAVLDPLAEQEVARAGVLDRAVAALQLGRSLMAVASSPSLSEYWTRFQEVTGSGSMTARTGWTSRRRGARPRGSPERWEATVKIAVRSPEYGDRHPAWKRILSSLTCCD